MMAISKKDAFNLLVKELHGTERKKCYFVDITKGKNRIDAQKIILTYIFTTEYVQVKLRHNPNQDEDGISYYKEYKIAKMYTIGDIKSFLSSIGVNVE